MTWWDPLLQWLMGSSQAIVGFVVGGILTGVLTWKYVIPEALKNPKIARFLNAVDKLAAAMDDPRTERFLVAIEKIVENQEKDKME